MEHIPGKEVELPQYQSHKKVWALKIRSVVPRTMEVTDDREMVLTGAMIFPEEDGYLPVEVSQAYVSKHDPQPGGYYVVYDDGYESWSPAKAFEEGYTRL